MTSKHAVLFALFVALLTSCKGVTVYDESIATPATDAGMDAQIDANVEQDADAAIDLQQQATLEVALASDTPIGETLCKNAVDVSILGFTFKAINQDVWTQRVRIQRVGVGSTSDIIELRLEISNVYFTGTLVDQVSEIWYFDTPGINTQVGNPTKLVLHASFNGTPGSQHAFQIKDATALDMITPANVTGLFPVKGNTFVIGNIPCESLDAGSDAPSNSAAYCDPLDWDPQKAYSGCCGTFNKVNPGDLKAGDLIRSDYSAAVYYYGSDGKRYLFPTSVELDSWYAPIDATYLPVHDYSAVCNKVLELTDAELNAIPIGGNVTKRPGAYVTGITTDPKRYVVDTHRVLRWASPQILEAIYGGPVEARTFLTPDAFFVNYLMGASIASADEYLFVAKYTQADIEVELGIKP